MQPLAADWIGPKLGLLNRLDNEKSGIIGKGVAVPVDDMSEKPMLGGCCVCLDERGWAENPLVYCDGQSCNVAVHQGKVYILFLYGNLLFLLSAAYACQIIQMHKNIRCFNCGFVSPVAWIL